MKRNGSRGGTKQSVPGIIVALLLGGGGIAGALYFAKTTEPAGNQPAAGDEDSMRDGDAITADSDDGHGASSTITSARESLPGPETHEATPNATLDDMPDDTQDDAEGVVATDTTDLQASPPGGTVPVTDFSIFGRKGGRARKARLQIPAKHYDPNTKAYCDALWMRVHEENCPMLILKNRKKCITLEQADKEGWRIGESGQSGRGNCCFRGYRRKYPLKAIPEDAPGIAQKMKSGKVKWHYAGCHRFTVSRDSRPMTPKEAREWGAKEAGFYMCGHCIERGPSLTTADLEALKKRPITPTFSPPEGWTPKAFSPTELPSKKEIDILIQETLAGGYGIQEAAYKNPVATLEEFMGRRFFFPVGSWLALYQAYRATGDKRLLEALRVSARHYRTLCQDYLDVAQLKARDPEGMAFMYSMAVSSRITLQLARKHPGQVSQEEIAEAEGFLKAMVATWKPICEGDDELDRDMGIPKALADDFRGRAFNRAANGIGTIATAAAALEDLQKIKRTSTYQPTIDRYRKCVAEWVKNWKKVGCLFTEPDGKKYFYYPYAATDIVKPEPEGFKLFGSDDIGHFSHTMQGVYLMYEACPESGVDDDFMTAIANAVHHTKGTKFGSIQCPSADRKRPCSRKPRGRPGTMPDRFHLFHAFNDGIIDSQSQSRLKVLHAQYMKAFRKNRGLIHLGDTRGSASSVAASPVASRRPSPTDDGMRQFSGLLLERTRDRVESGIEFTMGGALGRVRVLSVDEDALEVRGTRTPVSTSIAFEALSPRARASLAESVTGDDEAGYAVAAFFAMVAGDDARARESLGRAGEYAALVTSAFE